MTLKERCERFFYEVCEYDNEPFVNAIEAFAKEVRKEALEEALRALEKNHGHSSGCGVFFEFPFTKELTDGRCNCGTLTSREIRSVRALIEKEQD